MVNRNQLKATIAYDNELPINARSLFGSRREARFNLVGSQDYSIESKHGLGMN